MQATVLSSTTMTVDETRTAINAYLDALLSRGDFGRYLADDVLVTVADTGQEVRGREAAVETIVALHQQIFDAQPELIGLQVGAGTVAGEFVFAGTHQAEFGGVAATGKAVRVPYSAFYELVDGKITSLRLYGFASGVLLQLTAEERAATPAS